MSNEEGNTDNSKRNMQYNRPNEGNSKEGITPNLTSENNYKESKGEENNLYYDDNIPKKIGKGEDAKNSVVWHIVTYSLTIYSCIVSSLIVIDILRTGGMHALETVKDSWAVFTPIITLSLGYMFGKNGDDNYKREEKDKEEEKN